ncbi:hypothetical protein RN001_012868 [Aquatica leii]|uniref:Cytochrome P450 n=1 Tax=Aquatica leii TaxID=1421715 RepID=A0AAN7P6V5_9COLE|nr:hypothetical protein RN001_012868 [Aquatica leii]
MNHSFEKKKKSGAAGRKRRSLEPKEKEKSSKVFKTFFQKSNTSTSSSDNPENSASARPQELEDTGSSSSNKELVAACIDGDAENFSYNSKILATSEETEVGPEFDKEMKIDDVEDKDLISENVQIIKCPIPKIIEEHDIGFLMFSEETGKAIITDPLRIEIMKHRFKHFQNIEGPFLPTNNRSMNKTWLFKKLGNGHREQKSIQNLSTDMIILFMIVITCGIIYLTLTRNFAYWKMRNVPFLSPSLLFGNVLPILTGKFQASVFFHKLHSSTNLPYLGLFVFNQPFVLIRDLDIIKHILLKDFDYFINKTVKTSKHDRIGSKMLILRKDQSWRISRRNVSPIFTPKKLRSMFCGINQVTDNLINYIEKVATKNPLDSRNVGIKFGVNVVSSCLFGLKINALENQESEFLRMTLRLLEISLSRGIQVISCFFVPQIIDFFDMTFLDKPSINFMEKIFIQLLNARQISQLKYDDLIDILTEILNSPNSELTKDDLVAMAISLLSAGYETTGTSLTFLWYELSLNQNIQQRLRNEIRNELKNNKDISYDVITKIKYLDMVVNESLRKYPLLGFLDRLCVKTYKVPNHDLVIEKGTGVYISPLALHYDEKYFPNPDEFDPERFSTENKPLIPHCAYMPFGKGSRACIGARFAFLVLKVAIAKTILNFKVELKLAEGQVRFMNVDSGDATLPDSLDKLYVRRKDKSNSKKIEKPDDWKACFRCGKKHDSDNCLAKE